MISAEKKRYLFIGVINTVIGYGIGVGTYELFFNILDIFWIGLISNVISITVSFVSYKIFVFKTKGEWLKEYLRAYIVYGSMAIVSIFLLWMFVDLFEFSIWVAQMYIIGFTVFISYIGHSLFTFKKN